MGDRIENLPPAAIPEGCRRTKRRCGMLWGEGTMRKWWTAAAIAALWLGQSAISSAQGYGDVSGAGAMPEPLPISGGPGPQNPMVPPPGYGPGPGMPGMGGMPGMPGMPG